MSPEHHELAGKTIVIVGASSGFGRGAALAMAEQGANLVLAARRTNLLESLGEEIEALGGTALAVSTDVSDPDAIIRLKHAAIETFGTVDVWINNVGVGALGFFSLSVPKPGLPTCCTICFPT